MDCVYYWLEAELFKIKCLMTLCSLKQRCGYIQEIPGTHSAHRSKTNFGPTGHRHPRIPFHVYELFLVCLPFLKCILEVVFCGGVR
jgi:hypothetical protein